MICAMLDPFRLFFNLIFTLNVSLTWMRRRYHYNLGTPLRNSSLHLLLAKIRIKNHKHTGNNIDHSTSTTCYKLTELYSGQPYFIVAHALRMVWNYTAALCQGIYSCGFLRQMKSERDREREREREWERERERGGGRQRERESQKEEKDCWKIRNDLNWLL